MDPLVPYRFGLVSARTRRPFIGKSEVPKYMASDCHKHYYHIATFVALNNYCLEYVYETFMWYAVYKGFYCDSKVVKQCCTSINDPIIAEL